jgi:hypothetical protein
MIAFIGQPTSLQTKYQYMLAGGVDMKNVKRKVVSTKVMKSYSTITLHCTFLCACCWFSHYVILTAQVNTNNSDCQSDYFVLSTSTEVMFFVIAIYYFIIILLASNTKQFALVLGGVI